METKTKELTKIDGLGEKQADLLIKLKIDTIEKLKNTDPETIYKGFEELKNKGEVSYQISRDVIKGWKDSISSGEYKYTLAKHRYNSLKHRSFNEFLRLWLFDLLILKKQNPLKEPVDKINFNISNEIKQKFKITFNDMKEVRDDNKNIEEWEYNTENKKYINELLERYDNFFEKQLPYKEFKNFYKEDSATTERKCAYCKISEKDIHDLATSNQIKTKRFYSRGKTLEIDRTDPNGKYEIKNIKFCCYWCNNAKTDEFTDAEFTEAGKAFEQIWKDRLAKIK